MDPTRSGNLPSEMGIRIITGEISTNMDKWILLGSQWILLIITMKVYHIRTKIKAFHGCWECHKPKAANILMVWASCCFFFFKKKPENREECFHDHCCRFISSTLHDIMWPGKYTYGSKQFAQPRQVNNAVGNVSLESVNRNEPQSQAQPQAQTQSQYGYYDPWASFVPPVLHTGN